MANIIDVDYTAVVKASALNIRSYASKDSEVIGQLYYGETVKITGICDQWAWISGRGGWSIIKQGGMNYLEITDYGETTTTSNTNGDSTVDTSSTDSNLINDKSAEDDEQTFSSGTELYINESSASLLTNATLRGIHGVPYQYMSTVDRKIDGTPFGRKYAEKIIANMPLLLMTPGRPKFMKGYTSADKSSLLKALASNDNSTIEELTNSKNGRFYSFDFAYNDYYNIVNPMCHKVAIMLGIGDEIVDSVPLKSYDWRYYAKGNDALKSFITSAETVAFFIDSETQISENFSNDTGASQLSSTVNGLSDTAREIQFLLGASSGEQLDIMKQQNYDASMETLDKFTSKFSKLLPNGLMDKLKDGFLTVATGGKMLFPEIWADSQFSKSYDINIKLRTPDADKLSIYLNIFVPLLHLIGLAGAQQLNANSYKSPFLIRAYYKGFFNVDMGIITSLSISKGDKCKWTLDGLPTQIDISLNLKDLYQMLFLTPDEEIIKSITNTGELDYLSNLCGININKVDISRNIDIYLSTLKDGIESKLTLNHFGKVQQTITNFANSVLRSK